MRIREVSFLGVTVYPASGASHNVALPPTGLVLVTGPNGVGKSTIIEAVGLAVWGETLRRKPIWRMDGDLGFASVATYDSLSVTRERRKKKITLTFRHGGRDVEYETTTKAQQALDQIVSSYDLWRRTSVFSSQDASHFTLAPDSTRKKLLEDILGLDRFDVALGACRADLKVASAEKSDLSDRVTRQSMLKDAAQRRFQDASQALADLPPAPVPPDREKLAEELSTRRAALAAAEARQRAGERQLEAAERAAARLRSAAARKVCEACDRPLPAKEVREAEAQAAEAERALHAARVKYEELEEDLGIDAIENEVTDLIEKMGSIKAVAAEASRITAQKASLEKKIKEAGHEYEEACDALEEAVLAKTLIDKEVDTLEAVETVLSLTGVRAHMLSSALSSIQEIANTWLDALAGEGLRLVLTPYTETSSGTTRDSISFDIEGAGGGFGYQAASGGERRKIDLAVMLALGEVAELAAGVDPGTMFFDEVFDALDAETGVPAATNVLQELAQTRCVVVITHNDSLAQALRPVKHYRMENTK